MFDRNLRMLLGVHDLTSGDFAELIDVSATTMSYWITGLRDPQAKRLVDIAEFFAVPAGALMREEPADFVKRVGDPGRFTRVEKVL